MRGTRIRVAVVDDDRSVRRALHRLLTTAGFEVGAFESGQEFLASVVDWPPDCLILDLNMPGMTGRELRSRILERIPDLPVILMTAVENPEPRLEFHISGAAAYLPKPVEARDLIGAIGAALHIAELSFDELVRAPDMDQGPIENAVPAES